MYDDWESGSDSSLNEWIQSRMKSIGREWCSHIPRRTEREKRKWPGKLAKTSVLFEGLGLSHLQTGVLSPTARSA